MLRSKISEKKVCTLVQSFSFERNLGITCGSPYFCFGKSKQNYCHSQNSLNESSYRLYRRNIDVQMSLDSNSCE